MGHSKNVLGHSREEPRLLEMALLRDGSVAIHDQIREHLQYLINTETLPPGSALPSVRQFAEELSTARATVQRAYSDLQNLGLVESRHGSGTFVVDFQQAVEAKKASAEIFTIVDEAIASAKEQGLDLQVLGQAFNDRIRTTVRAHDEVTICYVDEFDFGSSQAELIQDGVRELGASVVPVDWRDVRSNQRSPAFEQLIAADLIVCAPYVFSEVRHAIPSRSSDIEGMTFQLHPEVELALSSLDPATRVGIVATRPEYLSWTIAVVSSRVVVTDDLMSAALDDAEALAAMKDHVDVVVYGTESTQQISEIFGDGSDLLELRHVPAAGSMLRIRELISKIHSHTDQDERK